VQAAVDFVPQGRPAEALLASGADDRAVALAVDPQRIDDVLENAHRERIGLLKDHPHPLAELDDIDARGIDRVAADAHVAPRADFLRSGRSSG
jgi:hypothetical protein